MSLKIDRNSPVYVRNGMHAPKRIRLESELSCD